MRWNIRSDCYGNRNLILKSIFVSSSKKSSKPQSMLQTFDGLGYYTS